MSVKIYFAASLRTFTGRVPIVEIEANCAQPILRRFGLESVVRPTLAVYNSYEDIDALVRALYSLV